MPVRLGYWQSQTSNVCSRMTGQWSDISAISLSPSDPVSYLRSLALRTWTSSWRREGSAGMDTWNAAKVQSSLPVTYRLMESSWQRGIAESGISRLVILMLDTPGDLVWDMSCMQQASYLEGGPMMWMLPLYLHGNKKSGANDDETSYILCQYDKKFDLRINVGHNYLHFRVQ